MKTELDAKHQRLWDYANTFMYKHIKDENHLNVFLESTTKFSDMEKAFLREAWFVITTGSCDPANKEHEVEIMDAPVEEEPKKTSKRKSKNTPD